MTLSLGILASGTGTNVDAIAQAIEDGRLDARIRLLVCNHAGVPVVDKARRRDIPTAVIEHARFATREQFDAAVANEFVAAGVELVAMAGFDRIVTSALLSRFPDRVLNIHPALLPAFRGVDAQAQAAAYGVTITGATVHLVDADVDHGPIVIQAAVPVRPGEGAEAVRARILVQEHRIYPYALQLFAEGRVRVEGRLVLISGLDPPVDESLISPPLPPRFR